MALCAERYATEAQMRKGLLEKARKGFEMTSKWAPGYGDMYGHQEISADVAKRIDEDLSIEPLKEGTEKPLSEATQQEIAKARSEIIERAGRRNLQERKELIQQTQALLEDERKEGEGKLAKANTIGEITAGEYVVDMDRGIVYLPAKGKGIFIANARGNSRAVVSVLEQTRFIENMEEGNKDLFLIFFGDYALSNKNAEMALSLKKRYPKNVILMKSHGPGSIYSNYMTPPEENEIYDAYSSLFKMTPKMLVSANGIVAVHRGIPDKDINGLLDLNEELFQQMKQNEPEDTPALERGRSRSFDKPIFGQAPFERFLQAIGAKVMIKANDAGPYDKAIHKLFFGKRLLAISSYGSYATRMSRYDGWLPKFGVFDLSKPIEQINDENILDITYQNPIYPKEEKIGVGEIPVTSQEIIRLKAEIQAKEQRLREIPGELERARKQREEAVTLQKKLEVQFKEKEAEVTRLENEEKEITGKLNTLRAAVPPTPVVTTEPVVVVPPVVTPSAPVEAPAPDAVAEAQRQARFEEFMGLIAERIASQTTLEDVDKEEKAILALIEQNSDLTKEEKQSLIADVPILANSVREDIRLKQAAEAQRVSEALAVINAATNSSQINND